jgi:hypothetical protein
MGSVDDSQELASTTPGAPAWEEAVRSPRGLLSSSQESPVRLLVSGSREYEVSARTRREESLSPLSPLARRAGQGEGLSL